MPFPAQTSISLLRHRDGGRRKEDAMAGWNTMPTMPGLVSTISGGVWKDGGGREEGTRWELGGEGIPSLLLSKTYKEEGGYLPSLHFYEGRKEGHAYRTFLFPSSYTILTFT